jgi:hypothetical protein
MKLIKEVRHGVTSVWVGEGNMRIVLGLLQRLGLVDRNVSSIPIGWNAEVEMSYEITYFDRNFPNYEHDIMLTVNGKKYKGMLSGDWQSPNGHLPVLSIN